MMKNHCNKPKVMLLDLNLSAECQSIANVQEKQESALLSKNNVLGVGVGHKIVAGENTGELCMTVLVETKLDKELLSKEDWVPAKVGGIPTDIIETGTIFAGSDSTLRNRIRPASGGYSVGHFQVTAGTIATCVKDARPNARTGERYYILSNNHVLANSNSSSIGDPILQPGRVDGGRNPEDIVARLAKYVPIKFDGSCNYVDAAVAEGDFSKLNREVYWMGYVKDTANATIGQQLQKTGRTTGFTTGKVLMINAAVNVNYGRPGVAKFCRQIITENMSAGGDSGSLVLDSECRAVGLLFAGSSRITIMNPIQYVMATLGVKFS